MSDSRCDMGCQPDWHKDDCAIYLPEPSAPQPADRQRDHEAGHPSGYDCDGDALSGPHETCARRWPQPADRVDVGLSKCPLNHGGEGNPARVYGHHGSARTCIRIKSTNEWVYDPAWENDDD